MKTTKRSKMLISSIAMLLVALVALGSATFAWYTITRTVTADNAVVNASTPGGLKIKESTQNSWTASGYDYTSIALSGVNGTFVPASLSFGTAGIATAVTTDANAENNYARTNAAILDVSGNNTGTYFKSQTFQVKSESAKAQTVTATVTATPAENHTATFMNMAVLGREVTDPAGTWTLIGTVKSAGNSHGAITSTGADPTTIQDNNAALKLDTAANFSFSESFATNEVWDFMVVVYADGMNENCKTADADTGNVTFNISFNTAD